MRSLKQNKILSLLGLATRASSVVSGEFMTEKCVKSGAARLVIVGNDASVSYTHLPNCPYRLIQPNVLAIELIRIKKIRIGATYFTRTT